MRTALLVADGIAEIGLVLLVLAGVGLMAPVGVIIPIVMCAIGVLLGAMLRMFVRDEVRQG